MDFSRLNATVDLSSYSLGEIKWGLYNRFPLLARSMKVGPGHPEPADATQLNLATRVQLTSHFRTMMLDLTRIPPTNTIDSMLLNQNFSVTLDDLVVDIALKETDLHIAKGTSDDDALTALQFPIARGLPVVSLASAKVVSDFTADSVRLTSFSVAEIEAVNAITEVVTLSEGQFIGKNYTTAIFGSAKVWNDAGVVIANELNTLLDVDNTPVVDSKSRPLTAVGKSMIVPLIQFMLKARTSNKDPYRQMCMRFIDLFQINRFRIPLKIGEYRDDTLEYAYYVLRETRAIRGGDKRDSTLAASSFYLPVTIDNRYAKSARDLTDFKNLISNISTEKLWSGNLILKGKHVPTILNRLMLFEIKFAGRITISCDIPLGWVKAGNLYEHQSFKFKLSKTLTSPYDFVIDYSMPHFEEKGLADADTSDIVPNYGKDFFVAVVGPFTNSTNMSYFIPSSFVHNLTGFHTSFEVYEYITEENYILASVRCNINRTFTMAFPERGPTVLHDFGGDALIITLDTYTRFVAGLGNHYDVPITKNTKFAEMFDELAKDHIGELDKIIANAARASDAPCQSDDENDEVPAPEDSPRPTKKVPVDKKKPKSGKSKPLDFDI